MLSSIDGYAQTSEKYNSEYENFYRAEELFEKEQYGAARKEFSAFIAGFDEPNDPMYIKASYYEAISALELYNNDAVPLLLSFNKKYPESIYKKEIYFRLGKHYYYKKKYKDVLVWFNKMSIQDVEEDKRDEFYFKMGYANFKLEHFDAARSAFFEIKEGISQYAAPAQYYFSHIAYQNENYQLALEGFLKLENDEKFGKVVPYYIAQIYYLQGKYELVTQYVPKIAAKKGVVNEKDMNLLIGDAFYRTGKYDEAVPYLEKYYKAAETTRDDDYRLGYAYYKSGMNTEAVRMFDRVKKMEDSLGQVAYYHIGECLIKRDNLVSARSAFEGAAFIDLDPVIQEDALYNYAILSYKLDINPYDEAVEAFEMYLNKYPNSERKEDVYQYLVNVYTSTNNYAKALASLDKLPNKDVRLKTAYQLIAYNQGVERFQKDNYQGAVSAFQLVKKHPIDPNLSGKAVYWIGDAYYRLKKYDLAIENYKKFALLPSMEQGLKSEVHYNIGYAYLKKADAYNKPNTKDIKRPILIKSKDEFGIFVQSIPGSLQKKADAYMRIADAHFVMKENALAVKYYKEALKLKSGYEDQALFYMGRTYGYMQGHVADKISNLLDIVNNYKHSKYLLTSIHEVAATYKGEGQFDKALQYYNQIVFDYPASVLTVDAKINVADIHYKQGKYTTAEQEYLAIIEEYGQDQGICKQVAQGLKDLYIATNQPERVEALAMNYACANISPDEKENLYYLPAIEVYSDSTKSEEQRYQFAIPKFEKYLEKFPTGRYKNEVQNYLANCHYILGNKEEAIALYKETLKGPNTGFTELAASRVAHYLFNQGEFEEVVIYYKKLEEIASAPELIFKAKLGLMRSNFNIENWTSASLYADKVLANSQINNELKLEAHYAKGMANFYLEYFNDAKSSLDWLIKNTTTIMAAEARYSIADIAYKQNDLVTADQKVGELIKMKPTYNYWVGKGLILRTRILMAQDDLFEAEENLRSVIDHYPIDDDGIIDEANMLWDELMQLKDAPKDLEEETIRIIEINEDEGN